MAKTAVKTKPTSGRAITPRDEAKVPSTLAQKMARDAGQGTSTAQEDNLVPLIYILQAQSPQANKRSPEYIEGAEAGSIWLRNHSNPIADGEEGIIFQPCHFSKDWVEWIPRDNGGGFVGRHNELPEDAEQQEDEQNPNRRRYVRPNGNELVETRYHVGIVHHGDVSFPYVIPMTSSGHSVSRQWMFMMNSKQLPGGGRAPAWACLYKLSTKQRTNAAGTWYTWDIKDAGWVDTEADYDNGKALHEAFAAGTHRVDAPEEVSERGDPDGAM